jgi:hypothetical protein
MEINKSSGQVEIIGPHGRIYLYTHDHKERLVADVHAAMYPRKRWDDPDYLAKIVFCHMVPIECWQEEKGYGIGTQLYADIDLLITLDTTRQLVTITSVLDKHYRYQGTFDEFVNGYTKSAQL